MFGKNSSLRSIRLCIGKNCSVTNKYQNDGEDGDDEDIRINKARLSFTPQTFIFFALAAIFSTRSAAVFPSVCFS